MQSGKLQTAEQNRKRKAQTVAGDSREKNENRSMAERAERGVDKTRERARRAISTLKLLCRRSQWDVVLITPSISSSECQRFAAADSSGNCQRTCRLG